MTGIQEYDYLSEQAKNALAIFNGVAYGVTVADGTLDNIETELNNATSGLTSVNSTLLSVSDTLTEAMALIEAGDSTGATSLIDTAKNVLSLTENSITSSGDALLTSQNGVSGIKEALVSVIGAANQGETLVNNLIPMINDAKKKIAGDLKTWNFYQCSVCSFGCTQKFKFKPTEGSIFLLTCALDQSKNAKYVFTRTETEGKPEKDKGKAVV